MKRSFASSPCSERGPPSGGPLSNPAPLARIERTVSGTEPKCLRHELGELGHAPIFAKRSPGDPVGRVEDIADPPASTSSAPRSAGAM